MLQLVKLQHDNMKFLAFLNTKVCQTGNKLIDIYFRNIF